MSAGKVFFVRVGQLSIACMVSIKKGNEYDNGGLAGFTSQSYLNQVKWQVLWKVSHLS